MMSYVKICGIRSIESARACVSAGADFLGFNFVPASPRTISPSDALDIIASLPRAIKIVGVFQNQPLQDILSCIDMLKLDFVQLHGEESYDLSELAQYAGIIKTVRISPGESSELLLARVLDYDADYILLDRQLQGKGEMVNMDTAAYLAKRVKLFFAGGLNPENISHAVRTVAPYAVDVASGVETNGVLDIQKVQLFISRAKEAALS